MGASHLSSSFIPEEEFAGAEAEARRQLEALTKAQAMVEFSPEGTVLNANEKFLSLFGYNLDEVIGRHHSMFVLPDEADSESYATFWEGLRKGEHQTATFCRLAKASTRLWIKASYIPILDGRKRVKRIVKYAVDVTGEQLQAADHRGQIAAIERALAVVEFEMDGTILSANDEFARILGYRREELLGAHHSFLVPAAEKAKPEYEKFWRELRRGQHRTAIFERIAKDGSSRFIQASYSPILDMRGKPFKVVKYASDFTEQKHTQDELSRAHDGALQASAAKSLFLATMSHEIRTPMNGVIAAADLLLGTELTSEQEELGEVIRSSGETLLALINDILDFSKLEAGKLRVVPAPMGIRDLFEEVRKAFSLQMKEKGLNFEVSVSDDVPAVLELDALRLRQVLINLVGNALKFTVNGGVVATAWYEPSTSMLEVAVRDTGVGIADTGMLFQEFSQEESSRTRKFGGTGLGLAICKKLVELMGGSIGADSEVNEGTEFVLTVNAPIVQQDAGPEQVAEADVPPGGVALIVDDNMVNRKMAAKLLARLGWDSKQAESGFDALSSVSEEDFDIVFMDCNMPGMDGFQATQKIRALDLERRSQVPIIALTANAMAGDREQCIEAGMDEFLSKPMRLSDLQQVMGRLLARTASQAPK